MAKGRKATSEASEASVATSDGHPLQWESTAVTRRESRSPQTHRPNIIDVVSKGNRKRLIKEVKLRSRTRPEVKIAKRNKPKKLAEEETCEQMMARVLCQKRMRTVCSRRLEKMSKPQRKRLIETWWDKMRTLNPQAISRLRDMLDAYEPYSPEQAYDYFFHVKQCKKRKQRSSQVAGSRNAVVYHSDGPTTSVRLTRKERHQRDMLLRLTKAIVKLLMPRTRYQTYGKTKVMSDLILKDMCRAINERMPYCCNNSSKALFYREVSDKVAVWVQSVMGDATPIMLKMEADEDQTIIPGAACEDGIAPCFCDEPVEEPPSQPDDTMCDCIKPPMR